MGRKKSEDGFWDGLLTMGGVLGLGLLLVEIIKLVATEEYRCPNCKATIRKQDTKCPNCQANLTWKV